MINKRYTKLKKIGSGQNGEVWKIIDNVTGVKFAIKYVKLYYQSLIDYQLKHNEEFLVEQDIYKIFKRKQISGFPRYIESSSSRDQAFIIFEKMGPSLDQQIDKSLCQKLSTTVVMKIGIQLRYQTLKYSIQRQDIQNYFIVLDQLDRLWSICKFESDARSSTVKKR
ncbi:isoform 2 of casein kinase i isoform delta [Stylonychia lemnae]|uniref:Isoform 2 of casein kinase i isoform delta n=1 Tax=Stylonychia lemnae TaxID=5949 RepID=A0A078AKR2_STYLE|nr:isoform 2 of casein kinase i isoform delta [Stylonychia lemnae]|eukprot:CDW82481.1 isoform 2 of casein kinase i isoform delta [Stylonychia lemnae]